MFTSIYLFFFCQHFSNNVLSVHYLHIRCAVFQFCLAVLRSFVFFLIFFQLFFSVVFSVLFHYLFFVFVLVLCIFLQPLHLFFFALCCLLFQLCRSNLLFLLVSIHISKCLCLSPCLALLAFSAIGRPNGQSID